MRPTLSPTAPANRDRLLAIGLIVAFSLCYFSVYRSLISQWMSNDVYAHGFLIPFISAYLLYERRDRLSVTAIEPHVASGSVLVGAGLCLLLVGHLGSIVSLAQLSLLVTLTGAVQLLFGPRVLRQSWIALAYLLFMIPVWEIATHTLQGTFQLISADIGAALLRAVGVPVRHDGVLLELPNVTLQVAEACSGVNFVVAILAVSIPQAYLMLSGITLRVLVTIYAVIVALLTNGLRVAVIGIVAYSGLSGPDIHGPGHILQGLSVALVGFIVVFATIYFLAKHTGAGSVSRPAPPAKGNRVGIATGSRLSPALAMGCSAAFLSVAAVQAFYHPTPVELLAPLATFPSQLDGWRGVTSVPVPIAVRGTGADAEISRRYTGDSERPADLYVGYYTYQGQAKELGTERMRSLHAASSDVAITLPDGSTFFASQVLSAGRNHYTLFWSEVGGRRTTDPMAITLWTIWNSLRHKRSDGLTVMLNADIPPGADPADVMRETQALAGAAAAALSQYVAHVTSE